MIVGKILNSFSYVSNLRYVVEITDQKTDRIYYTHRYKSKKIAQDIRDTYNILRDMSAQIFDTKTGEFT